MSDQQIITDLRERTRAGIQTRNKAEITNDDIKASCNLRIADALEKLADASTKMSQSFVSMQDRIGYLEDALLKMTRKKDNAVSRCRQLEAQLLEANATIEELKTDMHE